WRALEVPVDDVDEVAIVGQAVAQQPHQRGFALERAQAVAVERELVDPLLARLAVRGEPDLAAGGLPELALQHEIGTGRHRLPGREAQFAARLAPDRDARDRAVEAVADAGLGRDLRGVGLAERAAQLRDR